jgi:hypothetical protein
MTFFGRSRQTGRHKLLAPLRRGFFCRPACCDTGCVIYWWVADCPSAAQLAICDGPNLAPLAPALRGFSLMASRCATNRQPPR